jgi:hypothetical protein
LEREKCRRKYSGMGRRGREYTVYRQFETYRYKFKKESAAIDKRKGVMTQMTKKITEICPFI